MRIVKWLIIGAVGLVVLVVGGTWLYINVIGGDPPPVLSFEARDEVASTTSPPSTTTATAATTPTSSSSPIVGTWEATDESVLGYRVTEILFGQDAEGVGRTNALTGSLRIDQAGLQEASFTVDVASVTSDESQRDTQFRGRIMNVAQFPTASFTLTSPIAIDRVPADREEVTLQATGDLMLRGTTKSVTFPLAARRNGSLIEVNGTISIVFADYGIPNPSGGPATTQDHGVIEFLLVFSQ